MDIEKRKNYNKEYYQKNKEIILRKACQKVECEFCQRSIIAYNLKKHQRLPICERTVKEIEYKFNRINNI
jgi:hypothetical protein